MNARVAAFITSALAVCCCLLGFATSASAQTLGTQERLCDPTFEDCRADILQYIRQETVEIDMGFWMMTDARYSNELVRAWQRGVRIRLLMDPRCAEAHPVCATQNDQLSAAGIPMRQRVASGILHWKMVLFVGQGQLQFAGANYAPFEMSPEDPFVNFTDEIVYFSNTPSIIQSFMTKFDDQWISTTETADYANITGPLVRTFPIYPQDPELNFPPQQSYRSRAVSAYGGEQQQIDVMMFRITDEAHTNAMIAAMQRGVPVRLITDETEYRNPTRLWDAYNVDKMYNAGAHVRFDGHLGINHAKLVLLRGKAMSIFGSSNWTAASTDIQREHNMFTTKQWMYDWLEALFDRKWNNSTGHQETKPFVPLPPDTPAYRLPANGATGVGTSGVTLSWNAGLWAHNYDIYFGTTPNPPLLESNRPLGPSEFSTDYRTFTLPALQPGTTYYWKIVSKTMAFVSREGPVWSFTTSGSAPPPPPSTLPSGWSSGDVGATGAQGSASASNGTFTILGAGADVWGTADAFHYAYRPLNGDGSIVARVTTIQAVNTWTKAGVMIRGSLSDSSAHAFMVVASSPTKGVPFQRRTFDGNTSVTTPGSQTTAPRWVRLVRSGNVLSGYESADGTNWTLVGSDTVILPTTVFVGLAVTSHVTGVTARATFDNVTIGSSTPPPPNAPPTVSITTPSGGAVFTAPATIAIGANAADSDGTVTRVNFFAGSSLLGTDQTAPYSFTWSNVPAGTYSLTAVATDDDDAVTSSSAVSVTVNNPAPPPSTLPSGWNNGDVGATGAQGSASASNGTFTVLGAGADVWGTADAFHYAYRSLSGDGSIVARVTSIQAVNSWTKAGVMIRGSLSDSSAHAFMLVASSATKGVPFQRRTSNGNTSVTTPGSQSTAPRWVRLVRSGNVLSGYESADGTNWTLVGSDTVTLPATVFVGLAVTSHVAGVTARATFDNVTIGGSTPPPPNVPPTASITTPSSGAVFTAPATVAIGANAADSDGTVTKVNFFAGSTLVGTDLEAPYSFTWSNVPAGTYSLTAVATDDDDAVTSSSAVSVTVDDPPPPSGLPAGWLNDDVGGPALAGNAAFSGGVFTLTGSGVDIWESADQFQYAYRALSGNGTITARVTSIPTNVHAWVKAGVMIRESLDAGSRHALMLASASKGMAFQRRPTTGGVSLSTSGTLSTAPRWVRLTRNGDVFSAYESANGTSWTAVGTETIPMGASVLVGLAVTSHNASATATCTFDNVTIE